MTARPGSDNQLLVDLSMLVEKDDKSGIQRVVRSVLNSLRRAPPAGFRVEPVYDAGGHYAYARQFDAGPSAAPAPAPAGDADADGDGAKAEPVAMRPGDIFLGLDLCPNHVPANTALYADMRRHGVKVYFVVYDLLPILHPELFNPGAKPWFERWLATAAGAADGLLCISRAVADELLAWIEHAEIRRADALQVGYFHLGADIEASAPSFGVTPEEAALLEPIARRPSLLMVGTLEPRKMHAQALDACELLWQRGVELNLVIVGKPGWLTEQLAARLAGHPERGRRLFWFERASDETLRELYRRGAALLAASLAEGFGLPLIEAAQHRLALIARDIPVFREVAGRHAHYFSGTEAAPLAESLEAWLALRARGQAPAPDGMAWLSWAEASAQILRVITGQHWYRMASTVLD